MTSGRTLNTTSQDWGTPKKYVTAVREFFNDSISLDPCSNEYSIVNADIEYRLPKNDGLNESWKYPTIFVNPPYGSDKNRKTSIKHWLQRCVEANKEYSSEILALVPVATNTGHWKKFVFGKARSLCFLHDTRLKFLINGKEGGKGAPMACAMIYYGHNFEKFYLDFKSFGTVINLVTLVT